jgi:Prenyltransferase and squalene oxidase repeat
MPSRHDPATPCARAVAAACEFLIGHQDPDGHWRDYELPPGRSESWTTGCVGVAMHRADEFVLPDADRTRAVDHAVAALRDSRRPGGWGYNRNTACDADSTSWAVCLLAARDADPTVSAAVFSDYVTPTGGVRTFPSPTRFGSWADEHDEIAPLVGLALLALGDTATTAAVRTRILNRHPHHDGWRPFWWQSDAYVVAHSLTFLARSGGIPAPIAAAESARLTDALDPAGASRESSFDTAQRLITAVHLHAAAHVDLLRHTLLTAQHNDGSWPASPGLLVPNQRDPDLRLLFADDRKLLSTAMSVLALTAAARPS